DRETVFNVQRSAVEFESGAEATNCKDYFALKAKEEPIENSVNFSILQNYVLCDTLQLLQQAEKKIFTPSSIAAAGEHLARDVKVDSYASSLRQRVTPDQNSLSALLGPTLKIEPNAVVLDSSDTWHYELRIVARADVNGDGKEDWLLWWNDRSVGGNYDVTSLWMASNPTAGQPIALSAPNAPMTLKK
ncbi:MAG TPA: hypothetical protein PLQ67_10640, partial [Burkholderiaceae bacterium]|nr:hypothetical protein [Burkholderiaceae bacterium]